jgi:hypothetical protein
MSNMSYCRFRNTLEDLRDCFENLFDECGPEEDLARNKLILLCANIVSNWDEEELEELEQEIKRRKNDSS